MKSNEWYTPAKYIEAAREVMGGIDLDPASCELANQTVKAARYYSKEENGLMQPWQGRVWLNPPYGKLSNKSMLTVWMRKLMNEYHKGDVTQAVLLATLNIEAPWFADLWTCPLCFVDHEVRFLHPQGIRKCHLFGTVFAYLGSQERRFIDVFYRFGTVARRVSPAKERPIMRELWEALV